MLLSPHIIIAKQSLDSDDPYDVIYSNIDNLNQLFNRFLEEDEASEAALQSYYVDYYLAQVNNGGFSQFVYNSGWNPKVVQYVTSGLRAMNAPQHAALFEQSADLINRFSDEQLEQFLEGDYFGENEQRDILNAFDDRFYELSDTEDLIEANSQWLKSHPQLHIVDENQLTTLFDEIAAQIPDLAEREQRALERRPRYLKVVLALCESVGQELERITAGSPVEYEGQNTIEWHFLTDAGHFYMLDLGNEALMFDDNRQKISTIGISHLPAE